LIYSQTDFYIKDTASVYGEKVLDGGAILNSKQCEIEKDKQTITYSPNEIISYGFADGRIYFSRVININNEKRKVFLERLNEGKVNFYFYKDKNGSKYFLEKDSGQLVEIIEKSGMVTYKNTLDSYFNDCSNVSDALKLVTFHKKPLVELIDQYNSCSRRPFSFIKFGIMGGIGAFEPQKAAITGSVLSVGVSGNVLAAAEFKKDITFSVGAFIDIPISHSYFSFHPEIYYLKNNFNSHTTDNNIVNDILINSNSIVMPFLIRYTYPSLKCRPYVNAGCTYAYCFRNNNGLYTTTIGDNIIEIEKSNKTDVYSPKQVGYSIGGGIQYNLDYRKSLFLEFRYNNLFAFTENTYGNKCLECIVGVNL